VKIAALVQARMESTRLPGKAMMEINGQPLLEHVIKNVKQAVPDIFIITPPTSKKIIEYAIKNHIPYSLDRYERNVLDSFYFCAKEHGIENIVRITADNPLIRPETIKKVVDFYFQGKYDWAANCRIKTTYPVGDDAEVFSFKTLEKAWLNATTKYDHEHVTPYIYNHPELFKLGLLENDIDESGLRWTVDTLEDLEHVREICRNL
jgi:spore coat polysaccharide biosynthesis protein SpsF (cytidylyltransferase family)